MRQCAALSGGSITPVAAIGERLGAEVIDKVRTTWNKIKKQKLFYYNVGGMNVDSQINLLKRFYYSEVGRGNSMIFSLSYIKTTYEKLINFLRMNGNW